jgi:hypothetical protein
MRHMHPWRRTHGLVPALVVPVVVHTSRSGDRSSWVGELETTRIDTPAASTLWGASSDMRGTVGYGCVVVVRGVASSGPWGGGPARRYAWDSGTNDAL